MGEPSTNSLECIICRNGFRKLKLLKCGHSFCNACLLRLDQGSRIKCPYCRRETELSAFGIEDLPIEFGGKLQCCECATETSMQETSWCAVCKVIICRKCVEKRHAIEPANSQRHAIEPANTLGPVKFCMEQLDKFSAIHARLTMIQKELVKKYLQQLGGALERQLDDDLDIKIKRLKAEKRHLQNAFDIEVPPSSSALALSPSPRDSRFAYILNEVYKMSPTSQQEWADLGTLSRDGPVFSPLPVDNTVEIFMKQDKFVKFSTSMSQINRLITPSVPQSYIGSGILDNPCDLCSLPDSDILLVTCVSKGLFCFKMSTGELLRLTPSCSVRKEQFVGLAYEKTHKLYLVSVLRHYHEWVIQLYDQRLKLRQEISCPKEPHVSNGWYRWLTPLPNGRVLLSTGDHKFSVLWLLDLNANRWKKLIVKEGSTYRRAAFNQSRSGNGTLYVPDMQRKTIMTFALDTETWELSKESEIRTAEFTEELPIAVEIIDGHLLVVGYWNTGNIVIGDLNKCSSQLFTSVGPKELFGFHGINQKRLVVLCKQKELVQIYQLGSSF